MGGHAALQFHVSLSSYLGRPPVCLSFSRDVLHEEITGLAVWVGRLTGGRPRVWPAVRPARQSDRQTFAGEVLTPVTEGVCLD